jgi:hypothetical protein
MRKLVVALLMLAAFGFAAPAASAGPILFEGKFNQDGAVDALGSAPANWNLAAFDLNTGLGYITASITSAGAHNILVFLDIEIDEDINTFFNEFGALGGPPPGAGFGWEIDEPGYVFGDIYDNFLAGALDGLNGVPPGSPDDVSFALGRNFILGPDEVATLHFRTSLTPPAGGFYLVQTDPDSDVSVYFSSDLTIRGGGGPVIPEPGTLTLLGVGLAAAARRLRRRA